MEPIQGQPVFETPAPMQPMDFNANDLAEIELSRQIAFGLEKKDRLSQAKADAQYPAIQKSIEESKQRASSVLDELKQVREQLSQPPPTLVQGKVELGDLLAGLAGVMFGGRADQVVDQTINQANSRNQLAYQNQLQSFNFNREQAAQMVDFLQRQYLSEGNRQDQLSDLELRTQIETDQTSSAREWQASETDRSRAFQEREKAWTQLYSANTEGEVLAAARRLQTLDPDHAPDTITVDKAMSGARTRREQLALDYYKSTVGRVIESYQGVVPDSVRLDLEGRINAIAQTYDVDPKLFGEIPTSAFWKRQLDERELQLKREQWEDRLKFMKDQEREDILQAWARIEVSKRQAAVAEQNADTASARLAWQKVRSDSAGLGKKLDSQRQTKVTRLRGIERQLQYIKRQFGTDVRNPKTQQVERLVRFDKRKEFERLQLDWQQAQAEIEALDAARVQLNEQTLEAAERTQPPRTFTTQTGAKFQIGGG